MRLLLLLFFVSRISASFWPPMDWGFLDQDTADYVFSEHMDAVQLAIQNHDYQGLNKLFVTKQNVLLSPLIKMFVCDSMEYKDAKFEDENKISGKVVLIFNGTYKKSLQVVMIKAKDSPTRWKISEATRIGRTRMIFLDGGFY